MYYIIRKISSVRNVIEYTPIGYVASQEDAAYIDNFSQLSIWMNDNIDDVKAENLLIEDWLVGKNIYNSGQTAIVVPGNLTLIEDLDNPEGV